MNADLSRAWQPLTFGGVARYAQDWIGRLFVTCLIISIVVAAAMVWTVHHAWVPVINQAIANLPPTAEIRGGKLTSPRAAHLAENAFLAIQLDPIGDFRAASTADIQITLTPAEVQLRSLFGRSAFPYQPSWTIILSRAELDPWWNAWRPAVLGYIAAGTILFLFGSWIALGIVYTIPVLILGHFLGRSLSLWKSWKFCVAALTPGAVFMGIAVVLYGSGNLKLVELLGAWVIHFVIGWIFLVGGIFWLPRKAEQTENPFDVETKPTSLAKKGNPFANSKKETGADPPPHE